ncbi:MAG: hypothetical protein WCJ35_24950 [Planctomycetota bacterium]
MITPESSTPNKPSCRHWRFWTVAVVILIGCVVGLALWNKSASDKFAQQMAQSQPADPDARQRSLVLGTWADEYQGKRTMVLNEDGTGTMIVELTGWRAALSAPRLKFNMKWSLKDGCLKKQTISGEPETQVKMILSTMGDHVDEPILELTEDRLLLLDKDGKTRYDWKRVKENRS